MTETRGTTELSAVLGIFSKPCVVHFPPPGLKVTVLIIPYPRRGLTPSELSKCLFGFGPRTLETQSTGIT